MNISRKLKPVQERVELLHFPLILIIRLRELSLLNLITNFVGSLIIQRVLQNISIISTRHTFSHEKISIHKILSSLRLNLES